MSLQQARCVAWRNAHENDCRRFENRVIRVERDILKRATQLLARQHP